jgi:hypothetical protein
MVRIIRRNGKVASAKLYREQIVEIIKTLPEDKLAQVVDFVTFLKHYQRRPARKVLKGKIVKLGGIWKGFELSEEDIKRARKEIWEALDKRKAS